MLKAEMPSCSPLLEVRAMVPHVTEALAVFMVALASRSRRRQAAPVGVFYVASGLISRKVP